MNKETKQTLILAAIGVFIAIPDLIPVFGDCVDAAVALFGVSYFKGAAKLPSDHYDARHYDDRRHDDRRYDDRYQYPPRQDYHPRNDVIDVECRRVQ